MLARRTPSLGTPAPTIAAIADETTVDEPPGDPDLAPPSPGASAQARPDPAAAHTGTEGVDPTGDERPSLGVTAATVLAVAVVAAWTAFWAWLQWDPSGISWHYFADGTSSLLHGSHLHLYADDPVLQIGPLTFLAAALVTWLPAHAARVVAEVAMTATGPLLVWCLAPLVAPERRRTRLVLGACVLVPAWTVLSVRWAHLDDVLAMALTVAAIRAVAARRPGWAGLALGAAVASKPWALGFLPLLLVLDRRQAKAFAGAALTIVAAWAPFLLATPETLRALHPGTPVSPDAGIHVLGYRGRHIPGWNRALQLVAAPAVALVAVLRRRWPALFLVAFLVRLALDPQNLPYYLGAAALCALIFDLLATRWTAPWTTIVTVLVLWQPFVADFSTATTTTTGWTHWWFTNLPTVGAIHLAWEAAAVAFLLLAPDRWLGVDPDTPAATELSPPWPRR